jgi:hypothetical protein
MNSIRPPESTWSLGLVESIADDFDETPEDFQDVEGIRLGVKTQHIVPPPDVACDAVGRQES